MRALAMSMSSISTGMPTAETLRRLRVDERQDHVEIVNHDVENHVDVGAAALERRQTMTLDEAHRRQRLARGERAPD